MKSYLFKVYYIGKNYQGFQRQPNGQTIENHIESSFIQAKLIHSFKDNNYKGCSRTDHGVNAISNIFFINCIKKPNLAQLNYYLPKDITIWSFIQISSNFNPRKAIHKKYRYYLPKTLIEDPNQLDKLQDYLGTHDFTAFIKKHGAGQYDPTSTIYSITHLKNDDFHIIEISGNKFGREQIRRMIGFILDHRYHNDYPKKYLNLNDSIDIKSAPAELLYLQDITYNPPLKWKIDKKSITRLNKFHQEEFQKSLFAKPITLNFPF